jgi:hypothetical protein
MRYFCTYFDSGYLTRGLALYESLCQHCPQFTLWVLCLDQTTLDQLRRQAVPNMRLVSLSELEAAMVELPGARMNRSRAEYYFTCSPALSLFLLNSNPEIDLITYLDSDLYFYSDPEIVFSEIGNGSIAIIPHRFQKEMADLEEHGIYNVGWVTFRRDESGLACLHWWYERCIEWCYHRVEDGKYADQKYLDSFPEKFRAVVIIENKGANLAPWNISNYDIQCVDGGCTIAGAPLVFFHFQGFRQINRISYATGLASYQIRGHRRVLRAIFEPYIKKLLELAPGGVIEQGLVHRNNDRGSLLRRLLRRLKHFPRVMKEHLAGTRLLFLFGRTV